MSEVVDGGENVEPVDPDPSGDVWIDEDRKAVILKFDGVTGETFTVAATAEADSEEEDADPGDTTTHTSGPHKLQLDAAGQGSFAETFPGDHEGNFTVVITGSDGTTAKGTISVY